MKPETERRAHILHAACRRAGRVRPGTERSTAVRTSPQAGHAPRQLPAGCAKPREPRVLLARPWSSEHLPPKFLTRQGKGRSSALQRRQAEVSLNRPPRRLSKDTRQGGLPQPRPRAVLPERTEAAGSARAGPLCPTHRSIHGGGKREPAVSSSASRQLRVTARWGREKSPRAVSHHWLFDSM